MYLYIHEHKHNTVKISKRLPCCILLQHGSLLLMQSTDSILVLLERLQLQQSILGALTHLTLLFCISNSLLSPIVFVGTACFKVKIFVHNSSHDHLATCAARICQQTWKRLPFQASSSMLHKYVDYIPGWEASFLWIFIVGILAAGLECFGMGANNVANAFVPAVASGVLRRRTAFILCSIFDLLGCGLLGYSVTNTIKKGIVNTDIYDVYAIVHDNKSIVVNSCDNYTTISNVSIGYAGCFHYTDVSYMVGSLGAMIGASTWLAIVNILKFPVSVTHTVVGSTTGFSLIFKGAEGIEWMTIAKIVASWFISPLLAGTVAVLIYVAIKYSALTKKNSFEASIRILPFCYFFTVAVVIFLVLMTRTKYLHFDAIPLWGNFVAAIIGGIIAGAIVRIFVVKRIATWAADPETGPRSDPLDMSVTSGDETQSVSMESDIVVTVAGSVDDLGIDPAELTNPKKQHVVVHYFHKFRKPAEESVEVGKVFYSLQVLSGCCFSFTHGTNVIPTCVGNLVAIWTMWQSGYIETDYNSSFVPQGLIFLGWAGMVIGLWSFGHNIIKTIGKDVTTITPASGFCMQLGAAFAILIASVLGIPISSTHCFVGSVIFVSWYREENAVKWTILRNIVFAWLVTLPVAGLFGAAFSAALLQIPTP